MRLPKRTNWTIELLLDAASCSRPADGSAGRRTGTRGLLRDRHTFTRSTRVAFPGIEDSWVAYAVAARKPCEISLLICAVPQLASRSTD
jgi:hypothetical protein